MTGPYVQFASGGAMVRVASDSAITFNDDVAQYFGTGDTVALLYETADANANYLLEALPVGGATDVPVHVIGDANAINVDTGFFDGITQPTLAVLDADRDSQFRFGYNADDAPFIFSNRAIIIMPSGDTDDYLTLSIVANTVTLTATGSTFDFVATATTSLSVGTNGIFVKSGALGLESDAFQLYSNNADNHYTSIQSRDNAVGLVEIARLKGAADPYFQTGRDDTGVATNAITDGIVFQMGAGTNNEAAGQGFGMVFRLGNAASQVEERASWDTVLVTATDGSEDARYDWNLMSGGAMNLAMQLAATGVLDVDASSGLGAATVGLFDEYDDALILRQGISERKMEVLEHIGVMRKKESGSGWFMNVQAMSYLLAGGIYQTRQALEDVKDELMSRLESIEKELVLRRN